MADLHAEFDHGLRADCEWVGGISVARHVDLVDEDELGDWLESHPEVLVRLWDEMQDEQAGWCCGVTDRVGH